VSRLSRSAMLEVISQDYIRTARAKGQRERLVVYKHALRNMMFRCSPSSASSWRSP